MAVGAKGAFVKVDIGGFDLHGFAAVRAIEGKLLVFVKLHRLFIVQLVIVVDGA